MTDDRPQTRTYAGGESLPALDTDFRAVRVGKSPDGTYKPEIRAFLIVVENTSVDTDLEIKLGDLDGYTISPQQTHKITRINGVDSLRLKAESHGFEDYQIKAVEAHNSFNIRDKIEAFVQSVSMIVESSGSTVVRQPSQDTASDSTSVPASLTRNTISGNSVARITYVLTIVAGPDLVGVRRESVTGTARFKYNAGGDTPTRISMENFRVLDSNGTALSEIGQVFFKDLESASNVDKTFDYEAQVTSEYGLADEEIVTVEFDLVVDNYGTDYDLNNVELTADPNDWNIRGNKTRI